MKRFRRLRRTLKRPGAGFDKKFPILFWDNFLPHALTFFVPFVFFVDNA